jgi:hypothetical protein
MTRVPLMAPCPECRGEGRVPIHCDACQEPATEIVAGFALCAEHAAEFKDQTNENEK